MLQLLPIPWMRQAACAYHPNPEWWFGKGNAAPKAKAICAGCPVRTECLQYANELMVQHGIWGGLSRQEIRATRRTEHNTHCRHGHEYTPANTYMHPDGYRTCRTCKRGYATDQRPNNGLEYGTVI